MTDPRPNAIASLARIHVDDLDAALPLYEALAGGAEAHRFAFHRVRLAMIPPFLLLEGADDEARSHVATIEVRDVAAVAASIERAGGTVLDGPAPGPNGARLIARHPDGNVVEYIEITE